MREFRFSLSIPAHEYLAYYQGAASSVQVTVAGGQNVRFPASALRPFVSDNGVHGSFILQVDENNKLQSLRKIQG